jgi:Txe/YoeB family toxin of Txe-Axe toxin-antitoxin module
MNSINLSPYFKSFVQALNSTNVEYLLVGGCAVRYYGYLRSTSDLDIWTSTNQENAEKISHIIRSWTADRILIPPETFEHYNRIIRLSIPRIKVEIVDPIIGQKAKVLDQFEAELTDKIEILTVQTGVDFDRCYNNRVVDRVDDVEINIISLQDLKKVKQWGNRPQDQEDLAHLA